MTKVKEHGFYQAAKSQTQKVRHSTIIHGSLYELQICLAGSWQHSISRHSIQGLKPKTLLSLSARQVLRFAQGHPVTRLALGLQTTQLSIFGNYQFFLVPLSSGK